MQRLYMDNAATSFPKPEPVYQAVDDFNRFMGGSPGRGSNHHSLQAGSILLEAREELANLFNVKDSSQIVFTLNITAAINLALKGILRPGDHVITTSMEHNAVARPLYALRAKGIEWTAIPCSRDGLLDPHNIAPAIKDNTRLICMLHASNLTGTIMPVEKIGNIARQHNILFMLDSAQSAGTLELDIEKQKIDILTFTGHKSLMGPQGTGGLYIRPGIKIEPKVEGGTGSLSEDLQQPDIMPDYLEAGTPNVPGIAGLLAGVRFIKNTGIDVIKTYERRLTAMLLDGLEDIPGAEVYGVKDSNLQTAVVAFNIKGMDCGELAFRLDNEFGITSRSGLHCSPLAHKTVGTFYTGACRLSPGFFTTENDIDLVLKAIAKISKGK